MTEPKRIVLAEDNPNDVELTRAALGAFWAVVNEPSRGGAVHRT